MIGTVREIGLFRTTILTDDGVYVSIPNATIFAGTIQNLSREGRRWVSFHGRRSIAARISMRCKRPFAKPCRASRGC